MVDLEKVKGVIKRSEQTMIHKLIGAGIGAIAFFCIAYFYSTLSPPENSSVLLGLLTSISIGIGVGLSVIIYTTIINFTNTRKLIIIEAKLDEIAEKLSKT